MAGNNEARRPLLAVAEPAELRLSNRVRGLEPFEQFVNRVFHVSHHRPLYACPVARGVT